MTRNLLSSICLLAVSLQGVNGFVYTCNEIAKLISDQTIIDTKYACVALQDLLVPDTPFLSLLYLQDSDNGNKYSFSSFGNSSDICKEGTGKWKVVYDISDPIDCTYEITLLFTTVMPTLIVIKPHTLEYYKGPGTDLTFVSPRGGISLNWHSDGNGNEEVPFFTGIGSGENEQLFPITTFTTANIESGRDIEIFDPVVTVRPPYNITLDIGYSTFADKIVAITAFPGHRMSILSSGRSDTFQEQNTMKVIQVNYGKSARVSVSASVAFDPNYDHTLKLNAYCGDDDCGSAVINESTNYHLYAVADKYRVNYITHNDASTVGKNNDNLVIHVDSFALQCVSDSILYNGNCYQFSNDTVGYNAAESNCQARAGHLTSIHDQETNEFIRLTASQNGAQLGVLIGLHKTTGNDFTWSDGSTVDYMNGQLDASSGDCVILVTSLDTWSTINCDFGFPYVCKSSPA